MVGLGRGGGDWENPSIHPWMYPWGPGGVPGLEAAGVRGELGYFVVLMVVGVRGGGGGDDPWMQMSGFLGRVLVPAQHSLQPRSLPPLSPASPSSASLPLVISFMPMPGVPSDFPARVKEGCTSKDGSGWISKDVSVQWDCLVVRGSVYPSLQWCNPPVYTATMEMTGGMARVCVLVRYGDRLHDPQQSFYLIDR